MSLDIYKIFGAALIFAASLLAVIYPIKKRALPSHHFGLELGDAFASGIFLGAALFHMLPDAIESFNTLYANNHYPIAELCCALGFLLLLFLQRVSENMHSANHSGEHFRHSNMPIIIAVIIIIHAFIEGGALGVNSNFATAVIIFVAIIAHKSSESFALAISLNRSSLSTKQIIFIVALFSIMTPLGIAFGDMLTSSVNFKNGELLTAIFNAFAAGSFLYMSTLHHINHHEREHHNEGLYEFLTLCSGLSVMAIVAIWA